MLHDRTLTVREFWVIGPHLAVAGPDDTSRYSLSKFTVSGEQIRAAENGVKIAGSMNGYFAGLAKALNHADLLCPSRRRSQGAARKN
jgi:hypothetical protein